MVSKRGKATAGKVKVRGGDGVSTLPVRRYFTRKGRDVYDELEWRTGDVEINDPKTGEVFKQEGVEFPASYSGLAEKVVASKYFYGELGTDKREYSMRQVVGRVSGTIAERGVEHGYFSEREGEVFRDELAYLCLNQYGAFNSPVWFNVGKHLIEEGNKGKTKHGWIVADRAQEVTLDTPMGPAKFSVEKGDVIPLPSGEYNKYPQTSACFIQGVKDTMEDIMRLAVSEAMLFKQGSGTGTDLSTLRSSREKLSGGGKPSGPLGYLRQWDTGAGVIRSGGKTRRAAKMDSLRDRHPDIKEFIEAKTLEETKLRILVGAGLSYDDARDTTQYQNTNLSVRVSDEFMRAVKEDSEWQTVPIHNHEMADKMPSYKAKELFRGIAEGAWDCGDPGIQFHDTINRWHTCPNSGPINASNPCSEYMFLDDSSCNLASHNLVKYQREDGSFDTEKFTKSIQVFARAQDVLYKMSSFPEKPVAENSEKYRPLGMGFANLGALLMREGIPYDSDEARNLAAAITSLMTASVYEESARMAQRLGAFAEFEKNKEPMLNVIEMHRDASLQIDEENIPDKFKNIKEEARRRWESALRLGKKYGFRNAQATVLAPTGTISFMMDCDTTGVEPDLALVKYKNLAGGGLLKIVNQSVEPGLRNLGYEAREIEDIKMYIQGHRTPEGAPHLKEQHYQHFENTNDDTKVDEKKETLKKLDYKEEEIEEIITHIYGHDIIEGAPHLKDADLPVFDCSLKAKRGKRFIKPMGHVKMMAAVQPFLSGAISKTVNVGKETTVDEIEGIYRDAHQMGLKAIAIYRDGTKTGQPLSTEQGLEGKVWKHEPLRRRLPDTRQSLTHKFSVSGHEGYLTVGLYEDKTPGELFITMAKEGSTVGGLMDVIGTCTSMALQYGVPLDSLVDKFRHARFEPSGMTSNKEIPFARSIVDYIFTWMKHTFVGKDPENGREVLGLGNGSPILEKSGGEGVKKMQTKEGKKKKPKPTGDGKTCLVCGNIFEPTHCGDTCPTCQTPDFTGCEGGPV